MASVPFNNLITFSRGSNATLTGPDGLIQWAPNNLLLNSEQFDNAAWTKSGATIFPNQDIANGTLGSERITNGDFSAGSTDWTTAAGVTISGGGVTFVGAAGTVALQQIGVLTAGLTYQITLTVVSATGFNDTKFHTSQWYGPEVPIPSVAGTYTFRLQPKTANFVISSFSGTGITLDNISVRELTPAAATAPDGTRTADTLLADTTGAQLYQTATLADSTTYAASVYLKKGSGSDWAYIRFRNKAGANFYLWANLATGVVGSTSGSPTSFSFSAAGNGWYRLSVAGSSATGGTTPYVYISSATADTAGSPAVNDQLLVWGAQLELGSAATTYNSTTVKNLLGFSEAFDNAAWTKVAASIVTGAQANPVNGAFNAQKFMEDTTNAEHITRVNIALTTIIGTPYSYSVYAKAAGRTQIRVTDNNVVGATFTLTGTGATSNISGGVTASISQLADGWYRCFISVAAASVNGRIGLNLVSSGNTTYTGDGNSGVYIYGAQLSDSASLDPYVPTPAAAPSSTAYYGPRFDYDPVTLAPKGLLVEEARTNLVLQSNVITSSSDVTVTAGAATSPDGTTNAYRTTKANATDPVYSSKSTSMTVTANTAYTVSRFVKYDGFNTTVSLEYNNTSNWDVSWYAYFSVTSTGVTVSFVNSCTATVTNFGNGWYRLTATFTTGATIVTPSNPLILLRITGGSGVSVLGYGVQLEAGAFATSYIPTVASTVTRSADVATINGSLFSQWYGQTQGTFVVNASDPTVSAAANIFTVDDTTTQERIRLLTDVADPKMIVTDGNVTQANLDAGAVTASTPFLFSGAYQLNDFAAVVNGGTVVTDTSGTVPTVTTARLGADSVGNFLNGHIRSINYIPARAADFQLQALTL